MSKYLIVNIIDDLNKKDITRVGKIDVTTIVDIYMSDKNLLVIKTDTTSYYIKESFNDLSIQMIQFILGRTGGDISGFLITGDTGVKYRLVVQDSDETMYLQRIE